MELHANPLFSEERDPIADLVNIDAPTIHKRRQSGKLTLRDARRAKNAAEAIGDIDRETEVYGFTKGQFSIVDVIKHCLATTGPARLQICTWTASSTDVGKVLELLDSGLITASRWLVDLSFTRCRSAEIATKIRQRFGRDALRVSKNHAKFFLLDNDDWSIVCRTSMNLNHNPRFENFQLEHNVELWQFHHTILDHVWKRRRQDHDALELQAAEADFGEL